MNAKFETIKNAYGRFYNSEKYHYSINGWTDPESYSYEEMYEMMQEIEIEFGEHRCRPKSLQGIEDNNGWIKVENEKDLPKQECHCWIIDKYNGIVTGLWKQAPNEEHHKKACEYWVKRVSHYKIISKPEPPIY